MRPYQVGHWVALRGSLHGDDPGGSGRHMAVDAAGDEMGAVEVQGAMRGQRLVAGLAAPGEDREVASFLRMRVVAGGAAKVFRAQEALTGDEQLILVTVDIHGGEVGIADGFGIEVARQGLAGPEVKKRALFGMNAGVTDGADVQLLLAGER